MTAVGSQTNGAPPAEMFSGVGFGSVRTILPNNLRAVPRVASRRAHLRDGLPGLYQESDFGMRFVGALETVLDPILAVLDSLPAHFSADYAPEDALALLAAWIGVDLDEAQTVEERRAMVRGAAELSRRRGTLRGLELALELAFPNLPLRVEDNGGVTYGDETPKEQAGAEFVVYCDDPVSQDVQSAIARRVEDVKPVQATYRLRVKAPKKKTTA